MTENEKDEIISAEDDQNHKYITIDDVAAMAGVSKSTVSRVLNNQGLVSEKTRKKVMDIVGKHNYVPNVMARDLSKKLTNSIGIFIADISNQYFVEILKGAEEAINEIDYFPLVCFSLNPEREVFYVEEMIRRRTSGIIIASASITDPDLVDRLIKTTNVVAVQSDIPQTEKAIQINVTDKSGTFDIIKHLIMLGHRKIAYVDSYGHYPVLDARYHGYVEALGEYQIPYNPEYYKKTDRMQDEYTCAMELLNLSDPPTAIHCCNDHIASLVYTAIQDKGLKIPDDVSLTGFDDLPSSSLMSPRLTTVSQPIRKMGYTAVHLLYESISNPDFAKKRRDIVFPTQIILRGSSAPPRNRKQ